MLFSTPKHTKKMKKNALERAERVLEKVGISQYKDVKAGNLAYGIQRKVEIARALATDPDYPS